MEPIPKAPIEINTTNADDEWTSNILSERMIIERLFEVNGLGNPQYDVEQKRFLNSHCKDWLYQDGKLTKMCRI